MGASFRDWLCGLIEGVQSYASQPEIPERPLATESNDRVCYLFFFFLAFFFVAFLAAGFFLAAFFLAAFFFVTLRLATFLVAFFLAFFFLAMAWFLLQQAAELETL